VIKQVEKEQHLRTWKVQA